MSYYLAGELCFGYEAFAYEYVSAHHGYSVAQRGYLLYLEDEGIDFIDGLQKGFYAPIEVYINSEKQKGFYNFISYQVDGKWYVINGAMATPGA